MRDHQRWSHATDRRTTTDSVFAERRQALAWLASTWANLLIPLSMWPWVVLQGRLLDPEARAWVRFAVMVVVLCSSAIILWGSRVSDESRQRLKQAKRQRGLAWWERDRFGIEQAAGRLGWAPGPIVWTTRALTGLAGITTIIGLAVVAATW